jgi:hypothetical protein
VGHAGGCPARNAVAERHVSVEHHRGRERRTYLSTRFFVCLQMPVCPAVVVREAALFELMLFSRPGVTILVADRG